MNTILDEMRFRFETSREKANCNAIIAPGSYGAGYDLGYSDALGEMIEWIKDQMEGICEFCGDECDGNCSAANPPVLNDTNRELYAHCSGQRRRPLLSIPADILMEIEPMETEVQGLIKKSANASSADEAMKYAQAALNAANAIIGLDAMKKTK